MTFLSQLLDSNLEIVCCDYSNMGRHTLKLMGWVAEKEVGLICQRTKDALAAYKARGGKLGTHRTRSVRPSSIQKCSERQAGRPSS
jgi:DNA invertase Pin-like site-specific DNA recombinase